MISLSGGIGAGRAASLNIGNRYKNRSGFDSNYGLKLSYSRFNRGLIDYEISANLMKSHYTVRLDDLNECSSIERVLSRYQYNYSISEFTLGAGPMIHIIEEENLYLSGKFGLFAKLTLEEEASGRRLGSSGIPDTPVEDIDATSPLGLGYIAGIEGRIRIKNRFWALCEVIRYREVTRGIQTDSRFANLSRRTIGINVGIGWMWSSKEG